MEYKHSAGVKFDTVFKTGDTAKWTYKAVQRILTNEVYIGVLAQGKRGTPNYKVRVVQPKDETEWVKVEGAHEALVSYEDFMAVKTMMKRDMRCSPDQDEAHLFSRLPVLRRLPAVYDTQDRSVEDKEIHLLCLLDEQT